MLRWGRWGGLQGGYKKGRKLKQRVSGLVELEDEVVYRVREVGEKQLNGGGESEAAEFEGGADIVAGGSSRIFDVAQP